MSTVAFDTSMSLDGCMTAAGQTTDQPQCRGAKRHHHGTVKDA
jgi:hypothetical protein